MRSHLALRPAGERPPFGKLFAEEETLSVGSCCGAEGGHPLGAGGPEGQRSPGCSVGRGWWPMLGWLLVALVALGGAAAAPGFSCWKQCRPRAFPCAWAPLGPPGDTSYRLVLCYAPPRPCRRFEAGAGTTFTLPHHHIYVLTNATAWLEARWGGHLRRTPNLTLHLDEAVKPDPPPTAMPFAKAGGQLRLRVPWPPCHRRGRPPQREARFRRMGDSGWTQVKTPVAGAGVTCPLGGHGAFEVQLRHKLPHWSSYWSDWSGSIFVPEEILVSPVLSHQLGKLGRDGQRVLRLDWQRAPPEQGNVTYTLRARVPACRCAPPPEEEEDEEEEDVTVVRTEVTAHNLTLSGAEYEILLTATNAAGTGPARLLRVPAEHHADFGFEDVTMAGSMVTARWQALSPGSVYCFEQQPLLGAPKPGVCVRGDFPAKSIHVDTGVLDTPGCHRLAVHGWSPARGWATFALQYHYSSNASLAVPIHVNTSAGDAAVVLWWTPSPRAACPGVLVKYLICHTADGDNVTYAEANAAVSHYILPNLRPGTGYRVGVWEVTTESEGTCSPWWHFQSKALGPQGAAWKYLKYLGIALGLPAIAAVYQLSKKRARRLLFPPLPKPVGSKAVQFSAGEMTQGPPGFVEPSERCSPAELLLPEPKAGKEMGDAGTPQPSTTEEEPAAVVLSPPGCKKELAFTYRRQEVLSPPGCAPTSSTGHPPGKEEEEEEDGRCRMRQPLVPIALLISDKPVIIRDGEGWDPSPEKLVL
ncbi:interleukin-12 receptor subunit beta-1 [Pterocles gutturalis]